MSKASLGPARAAWLRGAGVGLAALFLTILSLPGESRATFYAPSDSDRIRIFLHTVDYGALVYDNFGHTALRVVDPATGSDWVFNWGMFPFGDPLGFAYTFYKGILIYELGIYPFEAAMRRYHFERRTVWEDELILSREEKSALLAILENNAKRENRPYRYHYFFDNCSTRPRDYIDRALGGRIHERFGTQGTGETFRDMVQRHYRSIPPIELSLDLVMNSNIDREMTVWEKAFLPMTLRDMLKETPSAMVPGEGLLRPVGELVSFPTPSQSRWHGHQWFALLLGVPLIAALACLVRARTKLASRLTGLVLITFYLPMSILGLLMPLAWLTSEHLDLHHNGHLGLFWPTDVLFLVVGGVLIGHGHLAKLSERTRRFLKAYILAHGAFIVGVFLLWLVGAISQDMSRTFAYIAPLMVLLWGLNYRLLEGVRP